MVIRDRKLSEGHQVPKGRGKKSNRKRTKVEGLDPLPLGTEYCYTSSAAGNSVTLLSGLYANKMDSY